MPSFSGLLDDGEILSLAAYIRSLASEPDKHADGGAKLPTPFWRATCRYRPPSRSRNHGDARRPTTTDHKRIAILYAITITIFFFMGGVAISLVRLELFTPNGGLLTSDTYNKLFSFHGIVMVWFFRGAVDSEHAGQFPPPLMIGAPDAAFPRLNLFSWYLTIAAGAFMVYALLAGGVDTGWTFYTPYSTMFSNSHVFAAAAWCSWLVSPASRPASTSS